MTKVLIKRSDGIVQRYNVKRGWINRHESSVESIFYNNSTRRRRIFYPVFATKEAQGKERGMPKTWKGQWFKEERLLRNKKELITNSPVLGEKGQIRVKLKARMKDGDHVVEGCSYKEHSANDMIRSETIRQAMIQEAINAAMSQLDGYTDDIIILKIDYKYFVDINETYS